MDIRKDKFLASLLAFGVMGAAACGGSPEGEADETATETTTGGDIMAEPEPMGGMEEEPMGMEPAEGDLGGETGMDEGEGDLGPTPE